MKRKFDVYKDGKGKVVVVTTFNGYSYRGIAKCAPGDDFNEEYGVALATARCKQKLYKAKQRVAQDKVAFFDFLVKHFEKKRNDATEYAADSVEKCECAEAEIKKLTED